MGKLIICSGAGISAESGIPTFRGSDGLWGNHKTADVCDMRTFHLNHQLVNEFYNNRREELKNVEPNSAHKAISDASKLVECINITTNADDLFERAGCKDVIHLHGSLTKVIPRYENLRDYGRAIEIGYSALDESYLVDNFPVKPAVTFFCEAAPMYQHLENAAFNATAGDIIIVVGSSENVVPFTHYFSDQWKYYEPNLRPIMLFVNPMLDNGVTKYDHTFDLRKMTATEFFQSQELRSLVQSLR